MDNAIVVELVRNALWISVLVSAPVVIATAAAGIFTGIVQVVTQIQDQTMQFLIKLIAAGVTLALTGDWIADTILNFANSMFVRIAAQ